MLALGIFLVVAILEVLASGVPLALIAVGILAPLGIALGFVLLIAPGLIFLAIWAVVVPVVIVERAGIWKAFGRSREMVEGNGVRVFAVVAVGFLVTVGGSLVFEAIGADIVDAGLARVAFGLLAVTIVAPVYALISAVLYFRLRGLEEALAPADPAVAG